MPGDLACRADGLGRSGKLNVGSPVQSGNQVGNGKRARLVMMKLQDKEQVQLQQHRSSDKREVRPVSVAKTHAIPRFMAPTRFYLTWRQESVQNWRSLSLRRRCC